MNFETNIGLEVHFELKTNSKIFSPSPVEYGAEPNSNTNVIDWAYPGVLPTTNKGVVIDGLRAAVALHAQVEHHPFFDRKNYFYPDNPKAYQITQFNRPEAHDGYLDIHLDNDETKRIGIHEMHIEEDAGKNSHGLHYSYVDLNRQGTPLIEIVSEPEMSTADEAVKYLETLRQVIRFTGISDVKMEEGSMRADVNVSIRPAGSDKFGTKVEMKNMNSFNFIHTAIEYEQQRQQQILLSGGHIVQETRRYDEKNGTTKSMRSKEGANDYRYFPEPDLPALNITDEWVNKIKSEMPEMPAVRIDRYVNKFGLTAYDADVLTQTKQMSDFFDKIVELGADPKMASNYLQGSVSAYLNEEQKDLDQTKITPDHLASLLKLIKDGTISTKMAKKVFKAVTEDKDPQKFVKENGMVQMSDTSSLKPIIDKVLADNPQSIEDFHNGKDRAKGFLVGQVMKQTRGKANPQMVNKLLNEALNK